MWPFRRRRDDDFRREIEAHLALEADRRVAEGLSPEEARHAASRVFGNVTRAEERFYESQRLVWLDDLRQDVRYAFRILRRAPGFAAVAILTLAIGIGANTAIFSVVSAVLLRPLPYADPGSLVLISEREAGLTPPPVLAAWRDRATTLRDVAGFGSGPAAATLVDTLGPEQVDAVDVTWNFFSFLGVTPAIGRDFTPGDAAPGAPAVVIVTHDFWQRRFGGDPGVVGRTVSVSGGPKTIVGVAAPTFRFPAAGRLPSYGLPADMQPDVIRVVEGTRFVNVLGRLQPGASPASAAVELLAIYRQAGAEVFARAFLDRVRLDVVPLHQRLVGEVRQRLLLVMGAVMFVLLVACANVANLVMARASTRHRELALRLAIGARTSRLARLVLTESLVLALLGSGAALLVAYATGGIARLLLADRIAHVGAIAPDAWVFVFNMAVAVATGLACGLAALPAVRRISLAAIFAGSAPTIAGRTHLRHLLLSSEVAATFVLVVGAALLAQTLWNLSATDRGFEARGLLTLRVTPAPPPGIARGEETADGFRALSLYWSAFFQDVRDRLQTIPGVTSTAAISLAPLAGTGAGLGNLRVNGQPAAEDTFTPLALVTPGYFETMRIPVVRGREFETRDRLGGELVAIVNEAFERRFSPGADIVGARVTSEGGPEVFTVVGVTRDVPDTSLRAAPEPLLIAPLAQMPAIHISWGALTFVLRTSAGDPLRLVPDVRRAIWAIDPHIVIGEVATMDDRVAVGWRTERDSALLFGLLAAAALLMAAIGVYGVAAYAIAQRTKEIGIRVALGAAREDIRRLVVRQTATPTLAGIAVGAAAAAMLTRLMASMMFGVTPLDPRTFALSAAILLAVALAAAWMPMRRAARTDPLVALRHD